VQDISKATQTANQQRQTSHTIVHTLYTLYFLYAYMSDLETSTNILVILETFEFSTIQARNLK
jgi:hypothetical protein